VGSGLALEAAMLWFDAYNIREDFYEFAFNHSETVRENLWSMIVPQCRMPKEQALGAPDPVKEHSKWFCQCQEADTPSDKLHEICQVPPSEMDPEVKDYCRLAQQPGRDRDLLIAKKFSSSSPKNPKLKEALRAAVGCDVMKNYPSHCRWSTNEVTDQGLYFMALIRQNNLEKPVAELCPDVCSHWLDVANKKIEQISGLKGLTELPESRAANRARAECAPEFVKGAPPSQYEKRNEWRKCQPPVLCEPGGKARVSVNNGKRELEYYELKFNPESQAVESMRHNYTHVQSKLDRTGRSFLESQTQPTFEYRFNPGGDVEKILVFDHEVSGRVRDEIAPEEILGRFNESAYNANSLNLGRERGEVAVSRRIEILMLSRKAIRYCCENELTCGDPSSNTPENGAPGILQKSSVK
jgi:hypothetical protein